MSEWEDISTAPKDGTNILAVWAERRSPVFGVIYWEGDGWHEFDDDIDVDGATHWMPLPSPPAGHTASPLVRGL